MSTPTETSDGQLLELLQQRGAMSVTELATASEVTATAIRQRLTRLMGQGLIAREAARNGRGRPSHRYSLTEKARRQVGNNFADLAIVLWNEVRAVKDSEVRRGLLQRLASSLAGLYQRHISGNTPADRMDSLKELLAERRVPVDVQVTERASSESRQASTGSMLTVVSCPYPELAEHDRGICAMENMLFTELVGTPMKLSQCRLDGHECCQFQTT